MKQETLYITQNSPYVKDLRVSDSQGPLDLTGYTPSMFIAKYFGSSTKYAVTATIHDAVGGIVRLSINSAGTAQLPYGALQYTVYLLPATGDKSVILHGQVIVVPTI